MRSSPPQFDQDKVRDEAVEHLKALGVAQAFVESFEYPVESLGVNRNKHIDIPQHSLIVPSPGQWPLHHCLKRPIHTTAVWYQRWEAFIARLKAEGFGPMEHSPLHSRWTKRGTLNVATLAALWLLQWPSRAVQQTIEGDGVVLVVSRRNFVDRTGDLMYEVTSHYLACPQGRWMFPEPMPIDFKAARYTLPAITVARTTTSVAWSLLGVEDRQTLRLLDLYTHDKGKNAKDRKKLGKTFKKDVEALDCFDPVDAIAQPLNAGAMPYKRVYDIRRMAEPLDLTHYRRMCESKTDKAYVNLLSLFIHYVVDVGVLSPRGFYTQLGRAAAIDQRTHKPRYKLVGRVTLDRWISALHL